MTSSPYHHQSNAKTESVVKEAKKILKKTAASKSDPYLVLLAHRNTPQEGFGTSPAQRLLSRRTKMQPFRLNEKTWRKAKVLKTGQKIVCSGVKWSALYQELETPETFCRS